MYYILCFTFFGGRFVVTLCKPTWFFLLYLKIGVKQLITTVSVLAAGTHWNNRLGSTCHCNLFSGLLWWNPQSFYFLDNKKRPAMQRTPFMKYLPLVHNELQRNPSSKLGSPPPPPPQGRGPSLCCLLLLLQESSQDLSFLICRDPLATPLCYATYHDKRF